MTSGYGELTAVRAHKDIVKIASDLEGGHNKRVIKDSLLVSLRKADNM